MNPILERLGYGAEDRVVIVHADDFGMCHATLPAVKNLFDAGLVTSAAVMVPCPWFRAAAALCRAHPELDIGVHTTLNCEWGVYRWGAMTTRDRATGLVDQEWGLPRSVEAVQHADRAAVAAELRAQLERALAEGIDVTHIDAHMGAAFSPRFVEDYLALGVEHRIPALLPRMSPDALLQRGLDAAQVAALQQRQAELERGGMPVIDHLTWMPLDAHIDPAERLAHARQVFDRLPPGLSYFILHPAIDTPELRAIAPDWRARVGDYETFVNPELRAYVERSGIRTIGYRALRDAMRAG